MFLKNPQIKEYIENKDYDVLCQNIEQIGVFPYNKSCWDKEAYAWEDCTYFERMPRTFDKMYNCGIIGFKNIDVRNEYFDNYHTLMEDFKINCRSNGCSPELVSEQKALYDLCEYKKYKVKYLLDNYDIMKSANDIGFQHLLGQSKYTSFNKTQLPLQKIDEDLYNKSEHLISTL